MILLRITTWFMLRTMKKEAQRLAKKVAVLYPESKSRNPNASEMEIIRAMAFNNEALAQMSENTRKRVDICCESIQGFCYMIALDVGSMKGLMNFRALQFTHYMDKELEAHGFPPQSKEQKERILEAMELKFDGWEKWSGD
jgi:hypothetical protein